MLDYLLSKTHSVGKWKAGFFRSLGFDETNADALERHLIEIAHTEDIKTIVPLTHSTKYVIDGAFQAPSGKFVQIRTVWIIDAGQESPRFVTAYPL